MKGYLVYCLVIVGFFVYLTQAGSVPIDWADIFDEDGSYSGGTSYGGSYHK